MGWTKPQTDAIYKRGSNIIVSAGAGSGKTAVLSERILEFCKSGGDIERVLVLTFTEAAAGEMKERIRKKLLQNNLNLQAERIDSAYITTFDSYSLSIVKRYYYLLGLEQGVSIMDGALIQIKETEIIRELFTEYYLDKNPRFLSYLRKYTLQDDKAALETIVDLISSLDLIVDLPRFIQDYDRTYFSSEKMKEITDTYSHYAKKETREFLADLKELYAACQEDAASAKMEGELELYLSHFDSEEDYTSLYQLISGFSMPRVSPKASELVKSLKDKANTDLKNLKAKVFNKYTSIEQMAEEIYATREDVLFLLDCCKEVMDRLMKYKRSLNMFGFSDIAKMAIELVKENDSVHEELRNSYDEILVDEYQDTSDIQEAFLSLIENHNRYMVGDIKQSIYRFRNANPYIFKSKYESYSQNDGGIKIDLSHNFRSRLEVLANINLIFNALMTNTCGDANYSKEHQMVYGQKDYLLENQPVDFNMEVLSYTEPEEDDQFTQAEREAFIIGKDIKDKLASGVKVLKKGFVPATYSDFAILISNATEFLTFKNVFEYLNIPLSIEASLDLKESILPSIYTNFLKAICAERTRKYEQEYYHSIASISRSFILEYSDEDIYQMVVKKKRYPIQDTIEKLAAMKDISYQELFFQINSLFHVYDSLGKIGDVDSSLVVLEQIHSYFGLLDSVGYSLEEAKEYMSTLLSSGIKMEYKPSSSAKNAVRIMTIHKSKGLEYPYCYFPLLTHGFNQADMRKTVGLSMKYGIFIPFADEGKSSTVVRTLYSEEVRKADISEKVRLFYVALTRAREKMILLLPKREYKEMAPEDFHSFADMLEYTDTLAPYTKDIHLEDYSIVDYRTVIRPNLKFTGKKVLFYKEEEPLKETTKARISAELKKLPDQKKQEAIALGLEFHRALEVLDFHHLDIDALPADDFIKNTLKTLLSHEIFDKLSLAKVYHEHEFYFQKEGMEYHGIIDLMLVYPDHVDIIDYKLSSTEKEEYLRQLSVYRDYVQTKSNQPVNLYLLSILKKEIKKIEI